MLSPAAYNEGDGLWVLAFDNKDHLLAGDLLLLDKPGISKLVLGDGIDA